jgi:hypothetical protein
MLGICTAAQHSAPDVLPGGPAFKALKIEKNIGIGRPVIALSISMS